MRSAILIAIIFALYVATCFAQTGNPLFVVRVNNKRGYIDRKGKIVIEPRFQGAGQFSDGLASVAVGDNGYKEGYIDETGKIVIEPKWDTAGAFHEGVAWVGFDQAKREYKYGNKTFYNSPSDSFDFKFGLIDKTGKYIVEPSYTLAADFSEGLALVRTKENKFGFVDKAGNMVIPANFDWAGNFSDGLAWINLGGKYGFIDRSGQVIIKPKFTDAEDFSEGLACVKLGGAKREPGFGMQDITTTESDTNYAYIDKTGKIVFKLRSGRAHSFSEGLARFEVLSENGEGFVDHTGKVVIRPQHGQSDFSDGLSFAILEKGEIGFIDKTGKIVLKPAFALADDFKNGLASVQDSLDVMESRYGYIDKTGNIIWKPSR